MEVDQALAQDTVAALAARAGLEAPAVRITRGIWTPTVILTGHPTRPREIIISEGVFAALDDVSDPPAGLAAVFAHELGHLARDEGRHWARLDRGFFAVLGTGLLLALDSVLAGITPALAGSLVALVLGCLGIVRIRSQARRREYAADAYARTLVSPDALTEALAALERYRSLAIRHAHAALLIEQACLVRSDGVGDLSPEEVRTRTRLVLGSPLPGRVLAGQVAWLEDRLDRPVSASRQARRGWLATHPSLDERTLALRL